jgi:hypothetical protein
MIKIKLIYKNGIRSSIDFLENEDKIHTNVKQSLLDYCRYNISQYKQVSNVELTCLICVDYSLFGNNSHIQLDQLISGRQTVIPTTIHIVPLSTTDDQKLFSHVEYNKSFNPMSKVMALKNINGVLISIKNEFESKYETVKVTYIELIVSKFNQYIPMVYIGDELIDISIDQFIKFNLRIGDELLINIETGELSMAPNNNNIDIDYKCICGKNIVVNSNKLICDNKYDICEFDYISIIDNYLDISDDSELRDIYANYENDDHVEFVEYLLSVSTISFYDLTNYQKCCIFNIDRLDIIFDDNFNIDQCLKSLTYSQGIPMKNKQEYINILKGLYNDK